MPSRRICPKCYFMNKKEGNHWCENCGEDISSVGIKPLSSECTKHRFYKDDQYFDECPVVLEEPKEKEPVKEEPKVRMVKICSVCGAKNPQNSPVCEKCNHLLMGTDPVPDQEEKEEPKEETPAKVANPIEEERIIHFDVYGFAFKLHNVFLPNIDFSGGEKCYIGRDHQKCLDRREDDFMHISRTHCYLRMSSKGIIFVGEEASKPSSWGTAVFKPRTGQYYKVVPGPQGEIAVEQGDQIILACDYSYTAFPIVVLKN